MFSGSKAQPRGSRRALLATAAMSVSLSVAGIAVAQPAAAMSITAYGKATSYPFSHSYGVDPLRYYERQCVSYAAWWVLHNNHKEIYFAGNASQWKSWAIKHHYKVNKTPAVGTVAWWPHHVAIVEYNGKYYIRVREFNYKPYKFDERWIKKGSSDMPLNYLYIK